MKLNKATTLAICLLLIVAGLVWLVQQYDAMPIATGAVTSSEATGGAAQFAGKHDIKGSPYFAQPDIYNLQPNDHLLILQKFATTQQITPYTCGPAAANMVVTHFKGKTIDDELAVAKIMGTSKTVGTNTKGMSAYFEKLSWEVHSSAKDKTPDNYEDFLKFVRSNLKNNTPIIVENIDWGGHWRVIIGYDSMGTTHTGDDVLLMADPFDTSDHLQDGYNVVPAERFFYMWFDHQLFPKGEQKRQWLTARPRD